MIIPMKDWQYALYHPLDKHKTEEAYARVKEQKSAMDSLEKTLAGELMIKIISDIADREYGLGKIVKAFRMYGGQINTSYGFIAEKDGKRTQYFLRKYNRFATDNIISMEHDFLKFLRDNGLDIIAEVLKSKEGKTYVTYEEEGNSYFYAIYEFLQGQDWYRWFEDTTPARVCGNIGEAVAKFHSLSSKYDTSRYQREEPGVYDMMGEFKTILPDFAKEKVISIYHQTYCNNLSELLKAIDDITAGLSKEEVERLPKVTVNGDLHQGNMKYDDEGNVVGLFDFDWVKTDTRLFEIAGLLLYLVTSWQDNNDGEIDMEKLKAAMSGYQKTLRELDGIGPMDEAEAKALPYFIQMCCIYNIVYWTAKDHYQLFDEINVYEYDYYLRHGLRVRREAEKRAGEITKAILES